ncbi:hypothetical protein [Halobacillus sp. KGW1]|uniref:hypothetical protein n=1 Tax=Halobacillus sp. KGW1 TaxID=1793726 RepID=UPI000782F3FF|nr:hypothetical protein [Halobacillus sp. KGW1]
MTIYELVALLKETGYPVAHSHFKNTKDSPALAPPFIVYITPETDNFIADNRVYTKVQNVNVELYTSNKDPQAEEVLEGLFDDNDIPYDAYQVYIDSEQLFQKTYEIGVI